jgi:hypothetical protein
MATDNNRESSLILEYLEALRADTAALRIEMEEIKAVLSRVEIGTAAIITDGERRTILRRDQPGAM